MVISAQSKEYLDVVALQHVNSFDGICFHGSVSEEAWDFVDSASYYFRLNKEQVLKIEEGTFSQHQEYESDCEGTYATFEGDTQAIDPSLWDEEAWCVQLAFYRFMKTWKGETWL